MANKTSTSKKSVTDNKSKDGKRRDNHQNGNRVNAAQHWKKQGTQRDVMGTPYSNQDSLPSKKDRKAAEIADEAASISRGNPVSYYTKFDTFAKDAANLPFAQPVGAVNEVTDLHISGSTMATSKADYIVPGIMALYFVPSIGVSRNFNSAINRSSIRFYTYLRSNQKASATYDHQDVTMMEVALDSCYMYHGLMSKLYGIINQFTPVNEYYSRATVAAMGGKFDDLRANLQDMRAYINAFAYQLGQYALPKDITLFDRHRWMVEGMYTDSDTTKAQTYMFVPCGFWLYDNTVETGSQCTWLEYLEVGDMITTPAQHTFAQLKEMGDQLINAISNEEDFAVISGDIYNFYGGDTYKLPYIDENYSVVPAYEKIVLSQIENASILPLDVSSLKITQNPELNAGAIIFEPKLKPQKNCPLVGEMNFHWDRPTPEDVIEASRLMAVTKSSSNTTATIEACGTEIICGARIFSRNPSTMAFRAIGWSSNVATLQAASTVSESINQIQHIILCAQFDWAPQLRAWAVPTTGNPVLLGTTWDVDNFDVIPKEYLSNIHLACLLSLFKVGANRD